LLVDRAVTREQLSFVALLVEPHRLGAMRASFGAFQSSFAAAYATHHERCWSARVQLVRSLESLAPTVDALHRLNALAPLGAPLAVDALAEHQALACDVVNCPAKDLSSSLAERPFCRYCAITLNDHVPASQFDDVARKLDAALAQQQRRLGSQAVRRILARGGDRLSQFVEIVQASDTTSLARLLDEDLVSFLQALLDQPVDKAPSLHLSDARE
jgi:hypothetical protein